MAVLEKSRVRVLCCAHVCVLSSESKEMPTRRIFRAIPSLVGGRSDREICQPYCSTYCAARSRVVRFRCAVCSRRSLQAVIS